MDTIVNNVDIYAIKTMNDHDVNQINQVLVNIEGALKHIESKIVIKTF